MKKIIAGTGFELTGTLMVLMYFFDGKHEYGKYNRVEYGIR